MTLVDLLVLYGVAGAVSAGVVYRAAPKPRKAALSGALLCVPLWPLWLPVVLSAGRSRPERKVGGDPTGAAIWEAHEAVLGTALEPLLPLVSEARARQGGPPPRVVQGGQPVDQHGRRHRRQQHGDGGHRRAGGLHQEFSLTHLPQLAGHRRWDRCMGGWVIHGSESRLCAFQPE